MTEQTFVVYHKKDPDFSEPKENIDFQDFEYVATVKCDTLEDAFRLTNSIDNVWWENPEVIRVRDEKDGFRSTSVGDLIISLPLSGKGSDVAVHIVKGLGFKKIG